MKTIIVDDESWALHQLETELEDEEDIEDEEVTYDDTQVEPIEFEAIYDSESRY